MIVNQFPDRTILVESKEYLYFGGTSYLGMATQQDFIASLQQNLLVWGSSYGSSRNANIKLSVYDAFEKLFAEQVGAEASLVISSGTLAGRLVTEHLSKTITTFYYYPKTHPAVLTESSKPIFIDGNLHPNLLNTAEEEIVITADAILGLETQPTSFDFLNDISPSKKITLIIDESHSLGVVGNNGRGIFNTVNSSKIHRKIMVSSLGKALALPSGIIASDTLFIDQLKEEALYVSSSGANPAYLATYVETQHIYNTQKEKLKNNLQFVDTHLKKKQKLHFTKNYPVIYSNSDTIFGNLHRQGIIIASFKYPTYKNAMNRMVITANHTKEDLKKLVELLNSEEL
jgi:7-keto-8-aminopelargonate synthetase-like enzyme